MNLHETKIKTQDNKQFRSPKGFCLTLGTQSTTVSRQPLTVGEYLSCVLLTTVLVSAQLLWGLVTLLHIFIHKPHLLIDEQSFSTWIYQSAYSILICGYNIVPHFWLLKIKLGAGEMALCIKCLLCKHKEDLSSELQNLQSCNVPTTPTLKGGDR